MSSTPLSCERVTVFLSCQRVTVFLGTKYHNQEHHDNHRMVPIAVGQDTEEEMK